MTRRLALVAALLCATPAAVAPAPSEPDFLYRVKKGDTLEGLAKRGLRSPGDYVVVQRHNRVPQPRVLQPGKELRIPSRLLRRDPVSAKVIAFRGAAQVNGTIAVVGMPVREGQVLETGANAFLAVELADGSLLTLPSRSRMSVAGLHRVVLTGDIVKRFRLLSGRVETEVQPATRKGDRFEVLTPVSVAAVRGTKFRATYNESQSVSGTGVIEGMVAVAAGKSEVSIPPAKGVIAASTGPGQPVDLLAKPALQNPDKIQDEEVVSFALSPVQGAAAYRMQLASDAGFVEVFAEADSSAPNVSFSTIPNGSFFARATALSAESLEGLPATYSFERRQNNVSAEAGEPDNCPAKRCLRFRWRAGGEGERRFRFQLTASKDAPPLVDVPEMTGTEIVITDLPGGTYFWRVESTLLANGNRQTKWMDLQELRVAPASKS